MIINMRFFQIFLFLFSAGLSSTGCLAETSPPQPLQFSHVWVAEAPPASQVMVAYMTIKNPSSQNIEIKSCHSKLFSSIGFHQSVVVNGMAEMHHLPALSIPAHGSLSLKPGSYHMMLFNPVKTLHAGDKVNFIFTLGNGQTVTVPGVVKKPDYAD